MLANAPAMLGDKPQVEDGLRLLNDAEAALRTPHQTLAALAANRSDESYELPEKYRFPGYDPGVIAIRPSEKRFESVADAAAWVTTAASAWAFRLVTPKPNLPQPAQTAEYALETRSGRTTVALFSDWGTGYYHSRYIARHIVHLQAAQAVHLGDVYYTGTTEQFDEQFTPVLDSVMRAMPLYADECQSRDGLPRDSLSSFSRDETRTWRGRGLRSTASRNQLLCLVNDGYK